MSAMTMPALRRLVTLASGLFALAGTSLLLAGPASADVPEGWPDSPAVEPLNAILVLVGIPVLLFVGILIAVYLPALIRGERVAPGAPSVEDQWLGGPRASLGELAGPDTADSAAGGASGRW